MAAGLQANDLEVVAEVRFEKDFDTSVHWTCPVCGKHNEHDWLVDDQPVCRHCGQGFTWLDI